MEIIFNRGVCECITGRLRKSNPWYIRGRQGHYYAAYQGDKREEIKRGWFRVFVRDLRKLQDAKYIDEIILSNEERRWMDE